MSDMEHTIEQVAKRLHSSYCECEGWYAECQGPQVGDRRVARRLAAEGLIAPAPLREEWHAAYYGTTRDGARHLRLIGTEGSREHAEETRADCAQDDPDVRFFLVRRPVHDWEPVDRAESDGSADQ